MDQLESVSPKLKARAAGGFYMVTVVASIFEHFFAPGSSFGHAAVLMSGTCYLVVALLLYELLKPVNQSLSLLAAFFCIVGISRSESSLAYFGVYSTLLGYLTFTSTFLPRLLGVVMGLAGFGLLLNAYGPLLWPSFASGVSSIGFTLDAGEVVFALWLLTMGVNEQKWLDEAASADRTRAVEEKHD